MLATASWHGLADPFDPIEALRHSAAYLRELVNQFGNLGLELCGRLGVREDRSRPIIDDLEPWLRAKLALISQKRANSPRLSDRRGWIHPYLADLIGPRQQ
jgi:hypothetical protein